MKKIIQNPRKNLHSGSYQEVMPANKRPKIGDSLNQSMDEDDDDPFAEDLITGEEFEEWERVATQAEIKLTQDQSCDTKGPSKQNGGTNFKFPSVNTNARGSKNLSHDKNDSLLNELQTKLKLYENKMKEMEQSYLRKDGETRILRDRLSRAEKNLGEEKVKYNELQKQQQDAERDQQKYIEKQVEKYKDQVEFKQAEIIESQNLIRNLEAKNKQLLENQTAINCTSSTKSSTSNFPEYSNWTSTQGGPSGPKKIKLVKPESPRVQTHSPFNNITFTDDPLGRKKSKSLPTTSASSADAERKSVKEENLNYSKSFRLKSKYFSNGLNNESMLQCLFHSKRIHLKNSDKVFEVFSPLLHLLEPSKSDRSLDTSETRAMEGIAKLVGAPNQDLKIFENFMKSDGSNLNSAIDFLPVIEKAMSTYTSLQENLSTFSTSSQKESFQTAVTKFPDQPPHLSEGITCLTPDKIGSICERALSAVKVLEVLSSHSKKVIDHVLQNSSELLVNLFKLCSCAKWNDRLVLCQQITACSLCVVKIFLETFNTEEHYNRFTSVTQDLDWLSLITCTNILVLNSTLDVLISFVHYKPFALAVIANQSQDSTNVLCHICDICCRVCPPSFQEQDWIVLQKKNVQFLSLLVAKHEFLLVEHSCYSEIYRAADVLLYNQLLQWKKSTLVNNSRLSINIIQRMRKLRSYAIAFAYYISSNFGFCICIYFLSRNRLIHSALCLLHSCANVYTDGIPGSRRDHRHQVVLIELENFLNCNKDKESFWFQELSRVVKAEVRSVLEEEEIS